MYKRLLLLILLVSALKEIVWVSLVPLWHFPDEQSHFGQLAYIAEKGANPPYYENNLTEEIRKSEELLGTERDILGINKYTYHPEYRLEYTNNFEGKYEKEIADLSKNEENRRMVKDESSHYPPFYYAFLASFYRLFYQQDIFIRVYIIRLFQISFSVASVYFAYLLGTSIFRNRFLALTLALLVSFQPMFSFVSAGINSDNAGNFIFTFYILMALRTLFGRPTLSKLFLFIIITFLTSYFKTQFLIVFFITSLLLFFSIFKNLPKIGTKNKYLLLITVITTSIASIFIKTGILRIEYIQQFLFQFNVAIFVSYVKNYAVSHLYREVIPWYWGVYDWLGVTYPRIVHRIINWISLISSFGIILYFVQRKRKFLLSKVVLLILISLLLVLGIYSYDWLSWLQTSIHLGVQGRYFFPAIAAHMLLLLLGFFSITPSKLQNISLKILTLGMIILNFYALYTVAQSYYDVFPFSKFITQASQYKPWFFKGINLVILWSVYLLIMIYCLYHYFRLKNEENN